jgi:hypothetical protein
MASNLSIEEVKKDPELGKLFSEEALKAFVVDESKDATLERCYRRLNKAARLTILTGAEEKLANMGFLVKLAAEGPMTRVITLMRRINASM